MSMARKKSTRQRAQKRRRVQVSRVPVPSAEHFHKMRLEYDAARENEFTARRQLPASGVSGDYHLRTQRDLDYIRERARDAVRNNPIIAQGIQRLKDNVLQGGFRLQARTEDPELNQALEDAWLSWSTDPDRYDVMGESDFNEQTEQVLESMIVDGDILAQLIPQTQRVKLIEGHRLRQPYLTNPDLRVVHGVEVNPARKHLAYYVTKRDVDPLWAAATSASSIEMARLRARDGDKRRVFLVKRPTRISQTRGVSAMAHVIDVADMESDMRFARLVQAQMVSVVGFVRNRDSTFQADSEEQLGEQYEETFFNGGSITREELAPGIQLTSQPGEKIEAFSANVPNPSYFEHAKVSLAIVGVNLGLPLIVLLMDASETNFSGWRGAMDQARIGFSSLQNRLEKHWHRTVYHFFVDEVASRSAKLEGLADRPDRYAHIWQPPRWPYIQPESDARADSIRLRNGLASPSQIHQEHGRDWLDVSPQIVNDNALHIEQALERVAELKQRFGEVADDLTWRDLVSMPAAEGTNVSVAETRSVSESTSVVQDEREDASQRTTESETT